VLRKDDKILDTTIQESSADTSRDCINNRLRLAKE
jgi:hypothetical protein